jgi:uncharacterized membrane protein
MSVGPIQVIVFGFDRTDQFRGEVLEELANLRGRGLVRLIDLFVALKRPTGELETVDLDDLTEEESVEFGRVIGSLLGVADLDVRDAVVGAVERTLAAASQSVGMDSQNLRQVVDNLPPGKAVGVLMFEHTWAIPLRDAIRRTGGIPLAQGFVTQEALVMVGEELRAIVEAERAIEVAEIVRCAAILDTLATLQEAEAIKTAIAADVLRTLAVAGLIEEVAIAEAIDTLAAAGQLEAAYLEQAVQEEAQEAAEVQEAFAVLS